MNRRRFFAGLAGIAVAAATQWGRVETIKAAIKGVRATLNPAYIDAAYESVIVWNPILAEVIFKSGAPIHGLEGPHASSGKRYDFVNGQWVERFKYSIQTP